MADLRMTFVLVVAALGFLAAHGAQGHKPRKNTASKTLRKILDNAVTETVITTDTAEEWFANVANSLTKQSSGEILDEALDIGWTNDVISNIEDYRVRLWASKLYPTIFPPLTTMSHSDIIAWLEAYLPSIEKDLKMLRGDKLKAVEIAASILREAKKGITPQDISQVIGALIKSALENNEGVMTFLKKTLSKSVSEELIPDTVEWAINRAALNAELK